ncbi:tetraspanin-9-like [Cimex lectularius]|uniref:Tetraspanin n=1 Tax=Cimex lectularius TaxID=79782 RepID=A0A8I6TCN1_CIMLE|nr:tetraspanin-9-like [Cimex lectularius]XP_014239551.1 tetraspanin-9-like [Cimex lectularius]
MDLQTAVSEDFEAKSFDRYEDDDYPTPPPTHPRKKINSVKYSLKLINTVNTLLGITFLFTTVILVVKREHSYFFVQRETSRVLNTFMVVNAVVVNLYSIIGIVIIGPKVRKSAVFLLALSGTVLFFGLLLVGSRLPSNERLMRESRYAMYESLGDYSNNKVYRFLWDYVQYNFHCCGVLTYRDWCKDSDLTNCTIADSCGFCNSTSEGRTFNGTAQLYHVTGCLAKVNVYLVNALNFYKSLNFLMISLLGLSALLSVAMFFRKFKPKEEKEFRYK